MNYVLDLERLTIANLTENNERRTHVWPARLGRRIPHLDARLHMLLDSPVTRDLLDDDEEGPETPIEELTSSAQLALLAMELAVGIDYIRVQLDGPYPCGFLAAAIEVFENMESWLSMDEESNNEEPHVTATTYAAYLISIYGFNRTVEDDIRDDPGYEKESAYPPDKVKAHCDALLAEFDVPEALLECIQNALSAAQLASEVLSTRPTFN